MNLRAKVEKDLKLTLEGDWGLPVALLSPAGVRYNTTVDGRALKGQVLYDIVRNNPETGDRVTVATPVVTLRRSSLARVPLAGESWVVEIPESPVDGATMKQFVFSPVRPPEGGASIGFIRLYLQEVEQIPPPPEEPPA